jgi:hypothetical protein
MDIEALIYAGSLHSNVMYIFIYVKWTVETVKVIVLNLNFIQYLIIDFFNGFSKLKIFLVHW